MKKVLLTVARQRHVEVLLENGADAPCNINTNESNIYARLGKHNVVIGTLPDGDAALLLRSA